MSHALNTINPKQYPLQSAPSLKSVKKVILLGSGALKIGEAGEFDYSGSQAIKALKEEGIETILVNPNIATIQTSEGMADKVYLLPVNPHFVEEVIAREEPDGIFLSFGGQTALNCGLKLFESGILERYNVRVLGTPVNSISMTEDRQKFSNFLSELGISTPGNHIAYSVEEALEVGRNSRFPLLIRAGFALGGLGAAVCNNYEDFESQVKKSLELTSQILIDEYLGGWKEIEYEVVRDQFDNCITVCNMENFDPLGIHTGESIVVAPSQTLNDREYQKLRNISQKIVRNLGIIGECNVQFALDPHSEDYRVIEVNARLSRSSALASKATGYPLAFIAAKLGLGYSLLQLKNSVTEVTGACFEPALDYITVKVPKWDLQKFRKVSKRIGPGMKSVGEVMAIGRNFEEAIQKAIRMVDSSYLGLSQNKAIRPSNEDVVQLPPTDSRIFALFTNILMGHCIDENYDKTKIDRWFLYKLENIAKIERNLLNQSRGEIKHELIRKAKLAGYADKQIAKALRRKSHEIRDFRKRYGILPSIKQIDTLAAEYPAQTNYLYMTYHGQQSDLKPADPGRSILVLGSGAYKIGSSVEFDWCCVNAIQAFRQMGYCTILVNNNPETVSTDYDECDRLYFDELTLERVLDICDFEKPMGVVVSMGGQIPNNLALKLAELEIPLLGTSASSIDNAEDRNKFSALLDTLNIDQPKWQNVVSEKAALEFASELEYPVIVRPSYVLSGAAMGIASGPEELSTLLQNAADISTEHPVVMSKFINNAQEIELDGVGNGDDIVIYAISEHVENAGVHSGDATLVCPPQVTPGPVLQKIHAIGQSIVRSLSIKGPFNIQFLVTPDRIRVIECNLRSSRSFPFVSKVMGINMIHVAATILAGHQVEPLSDFLESKIEHVGVKAPHFSFTRLTGADPLPGIEMSSTGEVGCLGKDYESALLKALTAVGFDFNLRRVLISAGPTRTKKGFLDCVQALEAMGVELHTTSGTHKYLKEQGIETTCWNWPGEKGRNVLDSITSRQDYDLVINIPKNTQQHQLTNAYHIRRKAVDYGIPLLTNLQIATSFITALKKYQNQTLLPMHLEEYQRPEWNFKLAEFKQVSDYTDDNKAS